MIRRVARRGANTDCEPTMNEREVMVLPDRIELSTSPLPRECSTTELRQHRRGLSRTFGPNRAGTRRSLPQGRPWRNLSPDRLPDRPDRPPQGPAESSAARNACRRRCGTISSAARRRPKGAIWSAPRKAARKLPGRALHRDPRFRRIWRRQAKPLDPAVLRWLAAGSFGRGRSCRTEPYRRQEQGAWIAFASSAGRRSTGSIPISGAKNATLPLMIAACSPIRR